MAHADLVREALASPALAFLGWTWFPEDVPPEWPHGAIRDGKLAPHARAQGFLSRPHRGVVLASDGCDDRPIRANAVRHADGAIWVYGGNFSRSANTLGLRVRGARANSATIEVLTQDGTKSSTWDGAKPFALPAMSLFRLRLRP